MNKTGKIAVFDSGIGGVSFLSLIKKLLPCENLIYYGDLANAPYGEQSEEFIKKRVAEIFDFFIANNAKIIVIACNTATSAAVRYLRNKYPEITVLGMEPAVRLAVKNGEKNILLLSTPITSNAPNTRRLIEAGKEQAGIINLPCGGLMDLVENTAGFSAEENLKRLKGYLHLKLDKEVNKNPNSAVVLGCTHYIYLRGILKEMYPQIKLYDGNQGTAENLLNHLKTKNLLNTSEKPGKTEFYSSVNNEEFTEKALYFMCKPQY